MRRGLKQADKRIAQNGIAQMANMRRLIGINAGVLDQNLFAAGRPRLRRLWIKQEPRRFFAVDLGIDVTRARDRKLFKSRHLSQPGNDFFRDLARRLPQLLGQLKTQRQRILTQADVRRLIDHHARQFKHHIAASEGRELVG